MKKLFAVLAVSAFLFACNSGETTETTTGDSTSTVAPVTTDSTVAPVTPDSTVAPVDSSAVDTTKK